MSSGEGGGAPVAEEAFLPGTEAFKIGVRIIQGWVAVLEYYCPAIGEDVAKAEKHPLPIAKDQVPNNYISACRVLAYFAGVNGKELRRKICHKIRDSIVSCQLPAIRDCLCIREDALAFIALPETPYSPIVAKCFGTSYSNLDRCVERAYEFFSFFSIYGANETYYSKSCAIVQSSVMGKSRLMFELAKQIPFIYIVNRPPKDNGYPISTPYIINEFMKVPEGYENNPDLCAYVRCVAFFTAAAEYTRVAWKMAVESGDISKEFLSSFLDLRNSARFWALFRSIWDDNTTNILAAKGERLMNISGYKVGFAEEKNPVAIKEEALEESSETRRVRRRILPPSVPKQSSMITEETTSGTEGASISTASQVEKKEEPKADQTMQPYWSEVEEIVGGHVKDQYLNIKQGEGVLFSLKMAVCVDEARTFSVTPTGCQWDVLTHLNRAARLLVPGGIFIFMDTLSDINVLYPRNLVPSSRLISVGLEQPVFTDILCWDIGFKSQGGSYAKYIEQTVEDKHMALYGRPMWYNMVQQRPVGKPWRPMILDKLIGRPSSTVGSPERIEAWQSAITLMSCLVHFNVTAGMKMVVELIGSHMAHIDYYDSKGSQVVLSYPSDPLVSMMASTYLNMFGAWPRYIEKLSTMTECRMIAPGDRGELVGMLLCIRAADVARGSLGEVGSPQPCVSVKDFLKQLAGVGGKSSGTQTLIDGFVTDANKGILEGKLNFNHFIRCENYTPNRADLLEILKQRQAVLCRQGQRGIDIILPVILPSKHGKSVLERTKISFTDKDKGKPEARDLKSLKSKYHPSEPVPPCPDIAENLVTSEHSRRIRDMITLEMEAKGEGPSGSSSSSSSSASASAVPSPNPSPSPSPVIEKVSEYELTTENVSYILIQCKCEMSLAGRGRTWRVAGFQHFTPKRAGIEDANDVDDRPYGLLVFAFDSSDVKESSEIIREGDQEEMLEKEDQALECVLRNLHMGFYDLENSLKKLLLATPNPLGLSQEGADRFAKACSATNLYGQEGPGGEVIDAWYRKEALMEHKDGDKMKV